MNEQTIAITRPSVTQPIPQKMETRFPSEEISIPSHGHFYSADNPLSSGTLELKQVTAKEEDLLTSRSLIQRNTVLDKLLE